MTAYSRSHVSFIIHIFVVIPSYIIGVLRLVLIGSTAHFPPIQLFGVFASSDLLTILEL